MMTTLLRPGVVLLCAGGLLMSAAPPLAGRPAVERQAALPADPLHRPLDDILDLNVRDGLVYYQALRSGRGALDRYVASLDVAPAIYQRWTREQRAAFWVNAYNVFVLRTVINHYPIRGRTAEFPPSSIRQIPGAFDRLTHRAAGRAVTLDEIEQTILPEFEDPRLHLALGRGAVGSGRLRSEAYAGGRLEQQLAAAAAEFVTRREMLAIDRGAQRISVTPIVSWNEPLFVAAYAGTAPERFSRRSPVERAVLALIQPHLYPAERAFVEQNQFTVTYHEFDWRLNDLTGGGPR